MIKQAIATLHQLEALNAALLNIEKPEVKMLLVKNFLPVIEQGLIDALADKFAFGDVEE